MTLSIPDYIKTAHQNSKDKGFWDKPQNVGEKLMLIVSEVAEALEEYRRNMPLGRLYYEYASADGEPHDRIADYRDDTPATFKVEGFPAELADVCIRVFDLCGRYEIDLERAIQLKMRYNATREKMHGGKVC